nr:hypothetical protein Q903MT_gene2615 [Picea sitchensis]
MWWLFSQELIILVYLHIDHEHQRLLHRQNLLNQRLNLLLLL